MHKHDEGRRLVYGPLVHGHVQPALLLLSFSRLLTLRASGGGEDEGLRDGSEGERTALGGREARLALWFVFSTERPRFFLSASDFFSAFGLRRHSAAAAGAGGRRDAPRPRRAVHLEAPSDLVRHLSGGLLYSKGSYEALSARRCVRMDPVTCLQVLVLSHTQTYA